MGVLATALCLPASEAQRLSRAQIADMLYAQIQEQIQLMPQDIDPDAFSPGWIERIELRTEANRLDAERQRYSIRFRPLLPHIRQAERRLQQAQRDQLQVIGHDLKLDLQSLTLLQLYDQMHMVQRIELLDSLYQLQGRLLKIRQLKILDPESNPLDLLDAEEDHADLALSLQNLRAALSEEALLIPLAQLVEVEQIAERLAYLEELKPDSRELELELSYIQADVDLQIAENRLVIDFLQFDFREDLLGAERFTVGGSIRLPRVRKHIRAIDELEVERVERSRKSAIEQWKFEQERRREITELRLAIGAYEAFRDEMLSRKARRMQLFDALGQAPEQQQEVRLGLLKKNLQDELDLIDEAAEIHERYVELLSQTALLSPQLIESLLVR